ncbi:MAG: hypothetical protein ACFCVE_10880 [Phycisphaerae bacterium]
MNDIDFQNKLETLVGEINTLPDGEKQRLRQFVTETRQRHDRMRTALTGLQDSLDQLRLSVKYLLFDVEATKRENKFLRKMLEETSGNE